MSEAYIYTSRIWLPLASAVLLTSLGLYSWRRRRMPGALPLAASSLLGALWLLGIAFEVAAVAPATKIIWFKFQAALKTPTLTAATCFALEYTYPGRWLNRRTLALLAVPSLLTLCIIVFNDSRLMWQQLGLAPDGSIVPYLAVPGAFVVVYALGLGLVDATAFLWLFIRSPQHRWPAALMLFGEIASRGLYLPKIIHLPWLGRLEADVLGFLLGWTIYAITLFGFRIFDPRPAARAAAIEQMREGVAVFDAGWRMVSMNPAAANILSTSEENTRGKSLAEILPAFPDLSSHLSAVPTGAGPIEISLGTGPDARLYAIGFSVLRDFRGPLLGYLLQFSDVTEQRRAQAQLLGRRWAEATQQEREQLAHELHDNLSQSLAFLNVQAQAVQLYLQMGQDQDARASLARLAEVAREMQSEVRELIGNLLAVSLPAEGFCATLRQIVARFETQTGLTVSLDIDDSGVMLYDLNVLPASTGVQLVRIVQEALANVRKHAGRPSQIGVRLQAEAELMQLIVEDNGAGFDPILASAEVKHFGLQVIRQRVARIGGQVAVHSAPGQGVRIEIRVPLGENAGTQKWR